MTTSNENSPAPVACVFLVDDDPGIRDSLQMVFAAAGLLTRAFESAEQLLTHAETSSAPSLSGAAGCLVLDLRLGGMSGLELLQQLRARRCEIPVVMISAHGDVAAAVTSMKLGAVDFVEKPFEPHELVSRVRLALERDTQARSQAQRRDAARSRLGTLTDRERELVGWLVTGRSSKQIAALLNISIRTVENHRSHILAKVGAENIADLVRIAMISEFYLHLDSELVMPPD